MTKQEYELKRTEILKLKGEPLWAGSGVPDNECARLLHELKREYFKQIGQEKRQERLTKKAEQLLKEIPNDVSPIPDDVLKQEDLRDFKDRERAIILQWAKNVDQTDKQIADAVNTNTQSVKAVRSLEAFKRLQHRIEQQWTDRLTLKSLVKVDKILSKGSEQSQLKISTEFLTARGILKPRAEESKPADIHLSLDPEKIKQLQEEAQRYIKGSKKEGS